MSPVAPAKVAPTDSLESLIKRVKLNPPVTRNQKDTQTDGVSIVLLFKRFGIFKVKNDDTSRHLFIGIGINERKELVRIVGFSNNCDQYVSPPHN